MHFATPLADRSEPKNEAKVGGWSVAPSLSSSPPAAAFSSWDRAASATGSSGSEPSHRALSIGRDQSHAVDVGHPIEERDPRQFIGAVAQPVAVPPRGGDRPNLWRSTAG
eukprot:7385259-Prymnesium_polylepis.3